MTRIFAALAALILMATISAVADADPAPPAQTTASTAAAAANSAPQIGWLQESRARPGQRPIYAPPYPAQQYPVPDSSYDPYPSYSYRNE